MCSINQDSNTRKRRATYRVLLFIYDLFSVNFAYFIAVLIRFSDADAYHHSGIKYMSMFRGFAPWYSLVCLWLFVLFRLYSGVWRFVGLNDFRRVLGANFISCVVYICGSLIIVGRMPISVYILGACIQFIMMASVRIAPRYIIENYNRTRGSDDMIIPLMIVGVSENTRIIQNKIARDRSNIVRPVCVVDYGFTFRGNTFNGLPVYCGLEAVTECIKKYNIRCVVIADESLPDEFIDEIRKLCNSKGIELRDFLIGTDNMKREIRIHRLLEMTKGPVRIVCDGKDDTVYSDAGTALVSFPEDRIVESISSNDNELLICIHDMEMSKLVDSEEWIRKYREETGDDISFF